MLFAHAYRIILVLRPIVVLNVSVALNAVRTNRVSMKDVRIHVLERAVWMLNVASSIIIRYALAPLASREIHLYAASWKKVSHFDVDFENARFWGGSASWKHNQRTTSWYGPTSFYRFCMNTVYFYALKFCILEPPVQREPANPCLPSPCGPNSQCREHNSQAVCTCLQNYIGRPPNCRPECTTNSECPSNLACINQKCKDPCPGSCGAYTTCTVNNHRPVCRCYDRYTGDPFAECSPVISKTSFSWFLCTHPHFSVEVFK